MTNVRSLKMAKNLRTVQWLRIGKCSDGIANEAASSYQPVAKTCLIIRTEFVGGGGNIAISTALPPSFCVLCCKHLIVYGINISYFFNACPRLRFPDVETNPGPRRTVPTVCRLHCSNVRGLAGNHSDLIVASSQYDILLCSETLVSDMRHVSKFLVSGFGRPVLLCRGRLPRARGIVAYVRDGYGAFR